jgi:hypothetical protein
VPSFGKLRVFEEGASFWKVQSFYGKPKVYHRSTLFKKVANVYES